MINKCEICNKKFYCARGRTVCCNTCRRIRDLRKKNQRKMKPDDIFDKIKQKIIIKETNEKFIARVEAMLYQICGCDKKRGRKILEECLKRNSKRKH